MEYNVAIYGFVKVYYSHNPAAIMQAKQATFLQLLRQPVQFLIPIYQRKYSWKKKHCKQLWLDIIRMVNRDDIPSHFVGSIVYIVKGTQPQSSVQKLFVIDGQQRLATITLLLSVLSKAIGSSSGKNSQSSYIQRDYIEGEFIYNRNEREEYENKVTLIESDNETLFSILKDYPLPDKPAKNIVNNYKYFKKQISSFTRDYQVLFDAINKLNIVDITLDRQLDNPQLIFESLNSKGLDLNQADLIRNYILMGEKDDVQRELFYKYWRPMEELFEEGDDIDQLWMFIRDYLTLKSGKMPNIREVYDAFKDYKYDSGETIEFILNELLIYAEYYTNISIPAEKDAELKLLFENIILLRVGVSKPFLIEVYHDYVHKRIDKKQFIAILNQIESYVFRRAVCDIPTNSLNKTFANISKEIDKENYVKSFVEVLLSKETYMRYPRDDEFKECLKRKDLYNIRNPNYWLAKLENAQRPKERVNVGDFTIEHIMPQNRRLSSQWIKDLGEDDWQDIHEILLHTIGNLTLTGYNPELSDKSFLEKRDMENGFADSPIKLNRGLAKLDTWNRDLINQRADELSNLAVKVWGILEV